MAPGGPGHAGPQRIRRAAAQAGLTAVPRRNRPAWSSWPAGSPPALVTRSGGASAFRTGRNRGYAGAAAMDGLLDYRLPMLARRALTALPAVALLAAGVDPDQALLWSQVVLSFGIPFALVPLIVFAARRRLMGRWANRAGLTVAASAIAATVIGLNLALIWSTV
ncbi:divalent metal cation transporter [Kutzneria sp. NPDC052558]|uniref:divalent metal cation transporter n=1 Tax=Kutzneria sp. NPDC052558 TaxID=3364121 RepID=UPI0037C76DFB